MNHKKEPVSWKSEERQFWSEGTASTDAQGKCGRPREQTGSPCGWNREDKGELPGQEATTDVARASGPLEGGSRPEIQTRASRLTVRVALCQLCWAGPSFVRTHQARDRRSLPRRTLATLCSCSGPSMRQGSKGQRSPQGRVAGHSIVERGPLPSLCHCDSHEGHGLALPAQRKGYASRA